MVVITRIGLITVFVIVFEAAGADKYEYSADVAKTLPYKKLNKSKNKHLKYTLEGPISEKSWNWMFESGGMSMYELYGKPRINVTFDGKEKSERLVLSSTGALTPSGSPCVNFEAKLINQQTGNSIGIKVNLFNPPSNEDGGDYSTDRSVPTVTSLIPDCLLESLEKEKGYYGFIQTHLTDCILRTESVLKRAKYVKNDRETRTIVYSAGPVILKSRILYDISGSRTSGS